jgi:hypothetical protein
MNDLKYVTIDVSTRLSQGELNRLLDHLNQLEGFSFSIKCETNTSNLEIKNSELLLDRSISSNFNTYNAKEG